MSRRKRYVPDRDRHAPYLAARSSMVLCRGRGNSSSCFGEQDAVGTFMAQLHYVIRAEEAKMANVFVEARPKGKPAGSPITDYIVEDRADHVLGSFRTQEAATHWARIHGHTPHVARVRHLNDKDKPDQWRKV